MSVLIAIASFALVLGILVFVHEFGHYAVAKLCGVRVEVFSLGFGKRILGFKRGDTDYRLSVLPLGGYVKMAGENPLEARTGDPGEFTSHPRWQRFLIAIAGPVMNILLAFVVFTGVYKVHYEHPVYSDKPVDVGVVLPGSAAEKAGIKPGDRIIRLLDIDHPTWEQFIPKIALNPKQTVDVDIQRGDRILTGIELKPQVTVQDRGGDAGVYPLEPALVRSLTRDLPAAKAGMQPGDRIIAAGNTPIKSAEEFIQFLQQNKSNPVQLTVLRDGRELKFTLTPEFQPKDGRYRIGFEPGYEMQIDRLPLGAAVQRAYFSCRFYSGLIFEILGKMVRNKISIRNLEGPVGIARETGEAATEKSPTALLLLMAAISLNLAIFNMLPIPILDGGMMLMLTIEGVMRRDIKQQVKERVYQVAFVFLVLLIAVVLYNDVAKALPTGYLPLLWSKLS
jgi:regulator of sigma E protease